MSDDLALWGESGGYVPCGGMAASPLALDFDGNAVAGESGTYVTKDQAAAAAPDDGEDGFAVAGVSEGYVAKPCVEDDCTGTPVGFAGYDRPASFTTFSTWKRGREPNGIAPIGAPTEFAQQAALWTAGGPVMGTSRIDFGADSTAFDYAHTPLLLSEKGRTLYAFPRAVGTTHARFIATLKMIPGFFSDTLAGTGGSVPDPALAYPAVDWQLYTVSLNGVDPSTDHNNFDFATWSNPPDAGIESDFHIGDFAIAARVTSLTGTHPGGPLIPSSSSERYPIDIDQILTLPPEDGSGFVWIYVDAQQPTGIARVTRSVFDGGPFWAYRPRYPDWAYPGPPFGAGAHVYVILTGNLSITDFTFQFCTL